MPLSNFVGKKNTIYKTKVFHCVGENYGFMCVPWRSHMCAMTLSYVWHASFGCVWHTSFTQVCNMTSHVAHWGMRNEACLSVQHDSSIRVTCIIHMCDTTRFYVWHDAFIFVTWHICMCDVTAAFICVTWRILVNTTQLLYCMCKMTTAALIRLLHSYVWHDAFM